MWVVRVKGFGVEGSWAGFTGSLMGLSTVLVDYCLDDLCAIPAQQLCHCNNYVILGTFCRN
jgi:hypothetical protein